MPKPTLVATYNSAWDTTTTPKDHSVTTQAGDRVLVMASVADNGGTLGTPTGNSLTYTLVQSHALAGNCAMSVWTATDAVGGTAWTLSTSRGGNAEPWGSIVLVFRASDGFGASIKGNDDATPGTPGVAASALLTITTTQANSTIVMMNSDWSAVDGATRTWTTINSITPTAGNGLEKNYYSNPGISYTTYVAMWDDCATAGAKAPGISAPGGQTWVAIVVEVKGAASVVTLPWKPLRPVQALRRSGVW